MSYCIYQTEGIILSKKDIGEADRLFSVFTPDFGKVEAMAQGARHLKSKLRYSLEVFSYSRFGLVMGKDWRVVDAEELKNLCGVRRSPMKSAVFSAFIELINKMVVGQDPDIGLWNEIKNTLFFLRDLKLIRNENARKYMRRLELLIKLRALSHLGYVADAEKWLDMSLETMSLFQAGEAESLESEMAFIFNKALMESQL